MHRFAFPSLAATMSRGAVPASHRIFAPALKQECGGSSDLPGASANAQGPVNDLGNCALSRRHNEPSLPDRLEHASPLQTPSGCLNTESAMNDKTPLAGMRLDKWLWAARFYKTRALATEAVENHRVEVNDGRAKPSREVRVGDRLLIRIGDVEWKLTIRGLSLQRGPAPVAQALYEEDPESHAARQQTVAERQLNRAPEAEIRGRPTKRDRRMIRRFTGE